MNWKRTLLSLTLVCAMTASSAPLAMAAELAQDDEEAASAVSELTELTETEETVEDSKSTEEEALPEEEAPAEEEEAEADMIETEAVELAEESTETVMENGPRMVQDLDGLWVEDDSDLKENSWRFDNGKPVDVQEPAETFSQQAMTVEAKAYTAKGIDVSRWQGSIDWSATKNDIDFAIIRCGFGTNQTANDDIKWETNAKACEKLGIPYGTYIYSHATTTSAAISEANHVLRMVKGHKLSYPVYLDLEDKDLRNVSDSQFAANVKAFADTIRAAGLEVGVYASKSYWSDHLSKVDKSNLYIWVAQWNSTCTYSGNYTLWQNSDNGRVSGISGAVDTDYWYGDKRSADYDMGTDPFDAEQAALYVRNLYDTLFHRIPTADEETNWVNSMKNGLTPAGLAQTFLESSEYTGQKKSVSAYIQDVSTIALGRAATAQELEQYQAYSAVNMTRTAILNAVFCTEACKTFFHNTYELTPGTVSVVHSRDKNYLVTAFAYRLYDTVLGRKPDNDGLDNWADALLSKSQTAAQVVQGFFDSQEYLNRKKTDEEFLTDAYTTILGRKPDKGGQAYWQGFLDENMTRDYILSGFCGSQEFIGLCATYGVTVGKVTLYEDRDMNPGTTAFTNRLYKICLKRTADIDGLNYWTGLLNHGTYTASKVANGFFFSDEFIGANYNNQEFITRAYEAILGRAPDKDGLADWTARMAIGYTRQDILNGFYGSQEFLGLCQSYGVKV